jgi:hypothetical protein
LLGRFWRRSQITPREAEEKPVEGKKERQKMLPVKSAPSDLGHTIEDPTAGNNRGNVAAVSTRGANAFYRG